jgi:uncharacterized OsmC-like protein
MTDTVPTPTPSPTPAQTPSIGPGSVSATRTGTRTYLGRNERGSEVLIGPADAAGHFTPGELFKLALAGCAGMSSDRVISRRLGDDYPATVWAHGTADPAEERYTAIAEELVLELDGLSEGEIATLRTIVGKAIDRACTVGRSVQASVEVTTSVNGVPVH